MHAILCVFRFSHAQAFPRELKTTKTSITKKDGKVSQRDINLNGSQKTRRFTSFLVRFSIVIHKRDLTFMKNSLGISLLRIYHS
jgi:hypothetical protein